MNPVLVEAWRGPAVESVHRGRVAVVDASGSVVLALGDVDARVFPRSAIKVLQALPLVASGAAERFGLSDEELALACASHNGEPAHVATARSVLTKLGLDDSVLECGSHWPYLDTAVRAMAVAGEAPCPLHNNCSGKHAGMITTAVHLGEDPRGYVRRDHPVQRRVEAVLADLSGLDTAALPVGIESDLDAIEYIDGACPGNDSLRCAVAPDYTQLAALQRVIDALGWTATVVLLEPNPADEAKA